MLTFGRPNACTILNWAYVMLNFTFSTCIELCSLNIDTIPSRMPWRAQEHTYIITRGSGLEQHGMDTPHGNMLDSHTWDWDQNTHTEEFADTQWSCLQFHVIISGSEGCVGGG